MNWWGCDPKVVPAVAICQLCRGVIGRAHCIRQKRPVDEHAPSDMAFHVRDTGPRVPRVLCQECAVAGGTGDREAAIDVQM